MAKSKYSNPFPDYARVKDPDKKKLAELAKRAQGDRTLTQFAADCGVSPSTLSRLMNAEGTKPNSDDLINALIENTDPKSGVTKEMFLEAHGLKSYVDRGKEFVDKFLEEHGDMPMPSISGEMRHVTEGYLLEMHAKETIISALQEKRYVAELLPDSGSPQLFWDFGFRTEAVKQYGLSEWVFDVKRGTPGAGNRLMNQIFARAYVDSPRDKGQKVSYVLDRRMMYEQLVERCRRIKIYDVISVILISPTENKVLEEFQIPCKDMELPKSIFKEVKRYD